MQGEVLGPIECSVTVDTFGKECQARQKYLYQYKGLVGVPPLAMVDDLACISVCGLETVMMNGFINAKTSIKKLQFGEDKCHRMHIGRETPYCPDLFIDNWKVKSVETLDTEDDISIDILDGVHKIEDSDEEKYLGDILSSDGSNTKNIKARKAKGFGIVDKISSMLEDIFFGPFFFEVALILRSSLFLNSILLNSEVWYRLTKADVEELESVDNALLRRILEAPACTPTPMLYLELGCIPITYIIMNRRIMYLQYLLKQDEDSLLQNVFRAQKDDPVRGDWIIQVKKDLDNIGMKESMEQIKTMSVDAFRDLTKQAISKAAFAHLCNEKAKLSKIMYVPHIELKMQQYLQPSVLEIVQSKLLFQLRSRMVEVKVNFRNKYSDLKCPACKVDGEEDSQQHIFSCIKLLKECKILVDNNIIYSDIFHKNIEKKAAAVRLFQYLWSARIKILDAE